MNVIEVGSENISYTYQDSRGINKISMQLLGMGCGLVYDFHLFANSLNMFCDRIKMQCTEPVILAHHCPIYFCNDRVMNNHQYIDYYDDNIDQMINNCIFDYETANPSHILINCMPCITEYITQKVIPPSDIKLNISYNKSTDIINIQEHIKQYGIQIHVAIPAVMHIVDAYFEQYDTGSDITLISISCSNTTLIGYRQSRLNYISTIGPGICDIRHSIEDCKGIDHNPDISSIYFINKNSDAISKKNLQWCIQHIIDNANKEIARNNLSDNIIILGHGLQLAFTLQIATNIFNRKIMHDIIYGDDIYSKTIYYKYNNIGINNSICI